MKLRLVLGVFAILAGVNPALAAECTYPRAPENIPNGKTASETDMLTAMTSFKQYNAEVEAYLACLNVQTAERVKDAGSSTGTIVQIKSLQAKKHNAAVHELKMITGEFNDQVRTFKSRK